MFSLLLMFVLPVIFVMSIATVLLQVYLAFAIRRDVKDILDEMAQAYQEGRQKQARSISTSGGID